MTSKNVTIEIPPSAEVCAKVVAKKVVRKSASPDIDFQDIKHQLLLHLHRQLEKYEPERSQLNTFCSQVIKNQAKTILQDLKKHNKVVCSLQDPIRQKSGETVERIEVFDQLDYNRETNRQILTEYELLEQQIDVARIIDRIEDNQLKTICKLLKYKNPFEISEETGIPRATIYLSMMKLRTIFSKEGLQPYENESRQFQRSFSNKKRVSEERRPMRKILTFSSMSDYQACPKKYFWRYEKRVFPLEENPNLKFGTTIHKCLERWHHERKLEPVLQDLDRMHPNIRSDPRAKHHWHMAKAMMTEYDRRYKNDGLEVICLEKSFKGPIINPATGAVSRRFLMAGVVDGVVHQRNENFMPEHKTTSQIDGSYLEKLWTNLQIQIYWHYIQKELNIKISGVIYNILVKPKLKQREGETQEQFEIRSAELARKNKSGRSTAKRRMPESDEDFQARLQAKCAEPGMFHREVLYFSQDQLDQTLADIWEITRQINDAHRRGVFVRNTANCFQYGSACPYYALCASGGDEMVMNNLYEQIDPHRELKGANETMNKDRNEEDNHEAA